MASPQVPYLKRWSILTTPASLLSVLKLQRELSVAPTHIRGLARSDIIHATNRFWHLDSLFAGDCPPRLRAAYTKSPEKSCDVAHISAPASTVISPLPSTTTTALISVLRPCRYFHPLSCTYFLNCLAHFLTMPPPKSSRTAADDHKTDTTGGPKEKGSGPTAAKMRRGASQSSASQLREAHAANTPTSAPLQSASETQAPTVSCLSKLATLRLASSTRAIAPRRAARPCPRPMLTCVCAVQINWSSFERDALHTYRREHQLNTPASFASKYHQLLLSRSGSIGLYSPTMTRKQQTRRQSKDNLAKAVRKHFNGLGIQENDVVVDFIYKIRNEKMARAGGPNRQPGIISEH